MAAIILIRGGGDLASGVAVRLFRAGMQVVITELAEPLVVRRRVAFAQAVFDGQTHVEEISALKVTTPAETYTCLANRQIPVLVDAQAQALQWLKPLVLVDGRMTKRLPEMGMEAAALVIGLGPGFCAGDNCHAVVETQRGHRLGRVLWQGQALPDSGIPEAVGPHGAERVLRTPASGRLMAFKVIGEHVERGERIAEVSGQPILAPFSGVLRGLVYPGSQVQQGAKVGDLDPRDDPSYCSLVSEKSLAIGGGVMEAVLLHEHIRRQLWD